MGEQCLEKIHLMKRDKKTRAQRARLAVYAQAGEYFQFTEDWARRKCGKRGRRKRDQMKKEGGGASTCTEHGANARTFT